LRELGVQPGDAVLTHSSFKSLGPGNGGPTEVVKAILDTVGPAGTALFPTHTWVDAGPDSPPAFDVLNTPSAKVGVIPEAARLWPGAIRSLHPTHSVAAIGRDAKWFTEGHYAGGICGIGSPYDRLCDYNSGNGYILLLGVDHERNTSLHMPEELLRIPDALDGSGICRLTDYEGDEHLRVTEFHSWRHRNFMVLDKDLDRDSIQVCGFVAAAHTRLVNARRLREFALHALRTNANYFWAD